MSATMLEEELAVMETEEQEEQQEEVVAPTQPKRRGPKAKQAEHKKALKKAPKK